MSSPSSQSDSLPDPPEGWQYGVVMSDGRVWGCGTGDGGRSRQRMRLRYPTTSGPCLLPLQANLALATLNVATNRKEPPC